MEIIMYTSTYKRKENINGFFGIIKIFELVCLCFNNQITQNSKK